MTEAPHYQLLYHYITAPNDYGDVSYSLILRCVCNSSSDFETRLTLQPKIFQLVKILHDIDILRLEKIGSKFISGWLVLYDRAEQLRILRKNGIAYKV